MTEAMYVTFILAETLKFIATHALSSHCSIFLIFFPIKFLEIVFLLSDLSPLIVP